MSFDLLFQYIIIHKTDIVHVLEKASLKTIEEGVTLQQVKLLFASLYQ